MFKKKKNCYWLANKVGQVAELVWTLMWKVCFSTKVKSLQFEPTGGHILKSRMTPQSAVSVDYITQAGWEVLPTFSNAFHLRTPIKH